MYSTFIVGMLYQYCAYNYRLSAGRWRFSAAGIFSLAKERLEPILNEAKPSILGNKPAVFLNFVSLKIRKIN